MKQEFRLPELGENIETGTVTAVMVEVGDIVSVDQPVIELETEKAVVEVPSSVSGTVTEINVKPGQTLNVGDTVFTVESKAEAEKEEPKPVEPREVPQSRAEKAPEGSAFPAAHERDKQQRQPEREQPEPRERREP